MHGEITTQLFIDGGQFQQHRFTLVAMEITGDVTIVGAEKGSTSDRDVFTDLLDQCLPYGVQTAGEEWFEIVITAIEYRVEGRVEKAEELVTIGSAGYYRCGGRGRD